MGLNLCRITMCNFCSLISVRPHLGQPLSCSKHYVNFDAGHVLEEPRVCWYTWASTGCACPKCTGNHFRWAHGVPFLIGVVLLAGCLFSRWRMPLLSLDWVLGLTYSKIALILAIRLGTVHWYGYSQVPSCLVGKAAGALAYPNGPTLVCSGLFGS